MDWLLILKLIEKFGVLFGLIVSILTVIGLIYGFIKFIDSRIEKKINEESFLRKIASFLRPTVIFDENESILVDQGAMEIIEKIDVKCKSDGEKLPEEILIYPKRHLVHAPLIQTLENEMIYFESTRDKGYIWRYKLKYEMYEEDYKNNRRFRLEIIL